MEKNFQSITELGKKLAKREVSSLELTKEYLKKIEKGKDLNAYISIDKKGAEKQAKEADRILAKGNAGALTGIPLAIKDNILIEGVKCTAGSKILENYKASYDAFVITKLKEASVVFLGKTNMDEFAMGSSTEHSAFGTTLNPLNPKYVPGGSSGGSAAAVASGQCAGSLGSDTGGSVRQPASFCGVVGFKPTYGAVSRSGLMAMASSLDQIGPITHTVEDARFIFDVIRGKDKYDATSVDLNAPAEGWSASGGKSLKIGVPKEYFSKGIDPRVEKKVREAIDKYKKMGAKILEIELPHTDYALATYYILMPSEVSSNLARYDGIRYGRSVFGENLSLEEVYLHSRGEGFGHEVKRRIVLGTYTLSYGYYDAYYKRAQKVRTRILEDFQSAWKKVDVIMAPTTPTLPFKIGEKTKQDPVSMYLSDVLTVAANIAGLPAISIPCGTIEEEGTMFHAGLQIIGKVGHDHEVLDVASFF